MSIFGNYEEFAEMSLQKTYCHAELVSASHQFHLLEVPKQVRDDNQYFSATMSTKLAQFSG